MFYVEIYIDDHYGWTLMGQYRNHQQAACIAAERRAIGQRVRITTED